MSFCSVTAAPLLRDPAAERLGLDARTVASVPLDEYAARVLDSILRGALRFDHDRNLLFVNYSQLPSVAENELLAYFGVEVDDDAHGEMLAVAGLHRNRPNEPFDARSAGEPSSSDPLRERSRHALDGCYAVLEQRRRELESTS